MGWEGATAGLEGLLQGHGEIGQGETALFRLHFQMKSFPARVVRLWNKLPREDVFEPSLDVFKAKLGGVWSDLVIS